MHGKKKKKVLEVIKCQVLDSNEISCKIHFKNYIFIDVRIILTYININRFLLKCQALQIVIYIFN